MNDYPPLVNKMCTPKVLWYQTDVSVVLRIMLPGVENYFLRLDEDHFRFSTIVGERKYYLCIYLFGAVIPEKCMHVNKGREIVVHIPKAHRWCNWLRLSIDKTRNPQITADPDKVVNSTEKVLTKSQKEYQFYLKEYIRQNGITQIMPSGDSSQEEDSDDEMMDMLFD